MQVAETGLEYPSPKSTKEIQAQPPKESLLMLSISPSTLVSAGLMNKALGY